MPTSGQLDAYLKTYRDSFGYWRGRVSEWEAHYRAGLAADDAKFRLTPDEAAEAERLLDEQYPSRHAPPEKPRTPFDELWERRTTLYLYCEVYRAAIRAWRGKLREAAYDVAERRASASPHKPTEDEMKKFKAWADRVWPERVRELEVEESPGVFGDDSIMRVE